jgi:hypothetical protein
MPADSFFDSFVAIDTRDTTPILATFDIGQPLAGQLSQATHCIHTDAADAIFA